jgi:hypothetical protein
LAASACRPSSTVTLGRHAGVKTRDSSISIFPSPVAVPEPSTWAMMLAGFTGLGALALSRKRKSTPA